MERGHQAYRKPRPKPARLVVEIPAAELQHIDAWGVEAGYPSRTAAVRDLLKRGLEAAGADVSEAAARS